MNVTSPTIDRRRFLRGCGTAVALPLLDVMHSDSAAAAKIARPPRRAAFFYIPNGVVQTAWSARVSENKLQLGPTLQPLVGLEKRISICTNLGRVKVSGTDGHAQASTCWLSSAAPDELSPAGYPLKRTLDQIIADVTGKQTPFRSLELSCNPYRDNRESIYFDNISWYGHGHVAASLRDPKKVFNRLFAVKQNSTTSSILDLIKEDAKSLERQLGHFDRRKLDEYLQSVRSVEKQLDRLQQKQQVINQLKLRAPQSEWTELRRDEFIQVMGDLMILALQTDMTRVASLMVAPERWGTPQVVHGVFDKPIVHHSMTHSQGDASVRRDLEKLDRFHVEQFARLVKKMAAISEGEKSLLDQSMFVLGSGLSSGKTHVYSNLPTVIAGTAGGRIRTNQLHESPPESPIGNLWLSLAQTMGSKIKRFSDSTGPISLA